MIDFRLIFVCDVRLSVEAHLSLGRYPVIPAALVENCLFPIELPSLVLRICMCELESVSLVRLSINTPISQCLDCYSFIVSLEVRWDESFNFVLLFQDGFGHSRLFAILHTL